MDELLDAFNELYEKYKSLKTKTKQMNQTMEDLTKENESLVNEGQKVIYELIELDMENVELKFDLKIMKNKIGTIEKDLEASLKTKSNDLLDTITKFIKGKENIDKLLSSQRPFLNKHGIGFSQFRDVPYENGFVLTSSNEKYIFIVKKQKQNGWVSKTNVWAPKTNRSGPKMIWVLKSLFSSLDAGIV